MNISQDVVFFTVHKNETLDLTFVVKENGVPLDTALYRAKFVIDRNVYGFGMTLTFAATKDVDTTSGKFYVKIQPNVLSMLESGRYYYSLRVYHETDDDVYYAVHGSFFLKEGKGE